MGDDDVLLKEVRERCRKQDPTLRILLKPSQMFIGNHAMKLNDERPTLAFEQNRNRKLSLRFYVGDEPRVGYSRQDFGVALPQIECISIKEEDRDHSPVLTCRMTARTMDVIFKCLAGLRDVVEKGLGDRKSHSRDMTFILQPMQPKSDYFVQAEFGEPMKTHNLEFDSFRSLLVDDFVPVWTQMLTETAQKRRVAGFGHSQQLVSIMDTYGLVEHLGNLKLRRNKTSWLYEKIPAIVGRQVLFENFKKRPKTDVIQNNLGIKRPRMEAPAQIKKLLLTSPISNLVKDRYVSTRLPASLVDKYVVGQHNDPDCYLVIYTRRVLEDMKRRSELAVLMAQVNRQFSSQVISHGFSEYQENYPNPHEAYIPSHQLEHFFGKQDGNMENYHLNGVGFKNVNELLNDDEMAEFFQPPAGDYYGQQVSADNNQQQQYQEMSLTPDPQTPESDQSPAPSKNVSYVSADTQLFTFPPRDLVIPGIDPVNLLVRDVRTLDRKEFVNDNVMSFMLNYIAVYMIDKQLMDRIHVCNTFFYSNLTRQVPTLAFSGRRPFDAAVQQQLVDNCSRVLRWTKKFDVFSKEYIVVPINEDYHWLLITVFNPSGAIVDMSNEKESREKPKCYVAFFDPLSGLDPVKSNHMTHCIKTYLTELYDKTKSRGKRFASDNETVFDMERVVVTKPLNLPIQDNFYDCGLYTLHFIEGLFCYLGRPVTVHDFPDFDWSARYPAANEMCSLMRDKIYNLVLKLSNVTSRNRLSRYERSQCTGLSQEGLLRKGRRHSAERSKRAPRHEEFRQRRYSVNPPGRNVMDDPMFLNPRAMAEMPATKTVRTKRWPEENFPIIY